MITYLYIKQHTVTGKLYFGKTTQNPETYLGSGSYWKAHIKKHGKEHVVNLWYDSFENQNSCTEFALKFSYEMNIVESDQWLNLKPENGLDGGSTSGRNISDQAKQNISKSRIGKPNGHNGLKRSGETKLKMSQNSARANKGKTPSEESRTKMKLAQLGTKQIIVTCPHCGKSGGQNTMPRWHFDKCKFNSLE